MLLLILVVFIIPVTSEEGACPAAPDEDTGGCGCGSLKRSPALFDPPSTTASKPEQATVDNLKGEREEKELNSMVLIPAGEFTMGTDHQFLPLDREGPSRTVYLDSFLIDKYEVTNEEFREFVMKTGHRTDAEVFGDSFVLEGLLSPEEDAKVASAVANAPWWLPVKGAAWNHPEGLDTNITGREKHPVVHVSWNDAVAFCTWRRKRLPTEAEFEKSCGGGASSLYPWGEEELGEGGKHHANIWQGGFPLENTLADGYKTTSPVGSYPPNGYGVHDLIGNVWEWVSDWWDTGATQPYEKNPQGPKTGTEKVKKGGSFMCTKQYCYRFRCPARTKTSADTTGLNVGFRCAKTLNEG